MINLDVTKGNFNFDHVCLEYHRTKKHNTTMETSVGVLLLFDYGSLHLLQNKNGMQK